MLKSALAIAAGMLAIGSTAWAVDNPGKSEGRMQGSPNAAGFGKEGTNGTASPGASSNAPDQGTKPDGRMQGSPNASGFKGDGAGKPSGSSGSR